MGSQEYIYTTGEVAIVCRVAPRTVTKWFESGKLKGYQLPGSRDRRIPESRLLEFMTQHGIPIPTELPSRAKGTEYTTVTRNVPKDSFVFFRDGTHWCCVRPDFINLQESPVGFGLTFKEAHDDFKENEVVDP